MAKSIIVASGKGGTGKTTFVANLGATLAKLEKKVVVIDMDLGMRNLDLYLGLENNVVFDVDDIFKGVCTIKRALISDKNFEGLSLIAASPKRADGEITPLHMSVLVSKLKEEFDFIIVDCPAGIEETVKACCGGCDSAIIVTTPEIAALKDSENTADFLRQEGITDISFVVNRLNMRVMNAGFTPTIEEIGSMLHGKILGIIQEDENIHISTCAGMPMVFLEESYITQVFKTIAEELL